MRYLEYYKNKGVEEGDVFDYLIETLQPSIKNWEYFIDWNKVKREVLKYKIELNIINSLIGSSDFNTDFEKLIKKYPEIVKVLPILLGVREDILEIREFSESLDLSCLNFNFKDNKSDLTDEEIDKYYLFVKESGLINLFINKRIKNFEDYIFGLETGLDSNGRKNRGGKLMENLIEFLLKPLLENSDYKYIKEANAKKIKKIWGYDIKVNKSSRRFDFVIFNQKTNKIFIIETNFFNGGGSKPKSVCTEFKFLNNELLEQDITFIWITDGHGWNKEKNPLEEVFNLNEYIFNLNMIKNNILSEILK